MAVGFAEHDRECTRRIASRLCQQELVTEFPKASALCVLTIRQQDDADEPVRVALMLRMRELVGTQQRGVDRRASIRIEMLGVVVHAGKIARLSLRIVE